MAGLPEQLPHEDLLVIDDPQCRHREAGSPPYGRDPAAGGLASYHQDHLVSSFGLAALGVADWRPAPRPASPVVSAKTSWNPAVGTGGTGWPVTGELIVKRASPNAAIAVSCRLCVSFTGTV